MTKAKPPLQEIARTRALHLNASVHGIVTGLGAALALFIATNWLILRGGEAVGPHLALVGQFFIGYRVTFMGSLVGVGYAFAVGYVVGYLVARIYNLIVDRKEAGLDGRAPTT